jgi:hypothetical protein
MQLWIVERSEGQIAEVSSRNHDALAFHLCNLTSNL